MKRLLQVCVVLAGGQLWGADFYVAPSGRASAAGSIDDPWDLATALAHPRAVRPGDTIWVRGGTYRGSFQSSLAGTKAAPIIVRAYGQERAILDSAGTRNPALFVGGSAVWYWGLEITNSDPQRVVADATACYPNCRSGAVTVFGSDVKLINLVIHNTGEGIGLWSVSSDSEAYGNVIFHTGWQSDLRGHGHGIYLQNEKGQKYVTDNIVFANFHSGIHAYGSSQAFLRNLHFEGNVSFNNGLLAEDPNGWGILVGGGTLASNVSIVENYLYNPTWYRRSNNLNPGYGEGTEGLVLRGNYSVGYKPLSELDRVRGIEASGNTFIGDSIEPKLIGQLAQAGSGNRFLPMPQGPGAAPQVFIRPNRYEPGRATVVVYNWAQTPTVSVDLSSFLRNGDSYQVIDVQNYFGGPVKSGRFDGSRVELPMNTPGAKPLGNVPGDRYRTSNEFGVFLVKAERVRTRPRPTRAGTGPITPRDAAAETPDAPQIEAVLDSASYDAPISPAALVTITGRNLAACTSQVQGTAALPQTLEGVSVTIAGEPAYLISIQPERIVAVAPDFDLAEGTTTMVDVSVRTTRGMAQARTPLSRLLNLFRSEAGDAGIAAMRADGSWLSTPARPGEQLTLYAAGMAGLGARPGDWLAVPLPVSGEVGITIGGVPAEVVSANLIGPGLARLGIVVPELPSGSHEVVLTHALARSRPGVSLRVAAN